MKVLIVDDEKNSRQLMANLLETYHPEVVEIKEADSGQSALFKLNKFSPHLIFLDIEMPDMDGFELLENIHPNEQLVCFATGYEKYAIKAINSGAFGYLLKPIDLKELKKLINRASRAINNMPKNVADSLVFNEGNKIWKVKFDEILSIEAYGNHSLIYREASKIISDFSLNELEELLPQEFMRAHRSHILNLKKVAKVEGNRTGVAILANGQSIPVANRRMKEVTQAFLDTDNG